MPQLTLPLHDDHHTIRRKVALQMVNNVLRHMEIPETVDIMYKGQQDKLMTWNSNVDGDTNRPINFGNNGKIEVELKENYESDHINEMTLRMGQYPNIWCHPDYPVAIRINYSPVTLEMQFSYSSSSAESGFSFRSECSRLVALDKIMMVESAEYILTFPKLLDKYMRLFYGLENNVEPMTISYDEWLTKYSVDNAANIMTNIKGEGGHPVFKERQVDLLGVLGLMDKIQGEKREYHPGDVYDLQYQLHFNMPVSMTLFFPVSIYNQRLHPRIVPRIEAARTGTMNHVQYSRLQGALTQINDQYGYKNHASFTANQGIIVPMGDDWGSFFASRYGRSVLTYLIKIDKEDEGAERIGILRWMDVEKYLRVGNGFKRFLLENPQSLKDYRNGILHVELARGNEQTDAKHVIIEKNLTVWCNFPYTRKDTVHARYTVPSTYANHTEDFFKVISTYTDTVIDIFGHLHPASAIVKRDMHVYKQRTGLTARSKVYVNEYIRIRYPSLEWSYGGLWNTIEISILDGIQGYPHQATVEEVFDGLDKDWRTYISDWNQFYQFTYKAKYDLYMALYQRYKITSHQYWGRLKVVDTKRLLIAGVNSDVVDNHLYGNSQMMTTVAISFNAIPKKKGDK